MRTIRTICGASLLSVLVAGCANTGRLRTFSDFSYPAGEATTIYLVADCLVLDDVKGLHHALDVDFNNRVCTDFSRAVASRIQDDSKLPVTVKAVTLGLLAGSGKYVKTTNADVGKVNLPLYASKTRLSPEEQRIFASVSERLNDSVYGWKQRQKYVNSLKETRYPLIKQAGIGNDALVMMAFMDGVRQSASSYVGQGNLSALFTLGSASTNRRSVTSAKAVLINGDGMPIWADATFTHDAIESDSQVTDLTKILLRYFPFRVAGSGSANGSGSQNAHAD